MPSGYLSVREDVRTLIAALIVLVAVGMLGRYLDQEEPETPKFCQCQPCATGSVREGRNP